MKRIKSQGDNDKLRRQAAEAVAIDALSFLAADIEHLGRFLAMTGIGPEAIRSAAHDPEFLTGVLDYMASDEALLVAFAQHAGLKPAVVERARVVLGGAWERDIP